MDPKPARVWTQDGAQLVLLTALYFLQGVPLGLCGGSLPFILKSRVSFTQIGLFSVATLPFSLKLLWAPLVDSIFWPALGRRKSWIIPTQVASGVIMLWLSSSINGLVADARIALLTACFFVLVMLFATQDIAVDGMALEILQPRNLAYAATSQSVGQSLGFYLSFSVFLGLEAYGVVDLSQFVAVCGVLFIVGSAWLLLAVREAAPPVSHDIWKTYKQLWDVANLPAVRLLSIYLLTAYLPLVASDRALHLRFSDSGIPKAWLAFLSGCTLPLSLVFAVVTGRLARQGAPLTRGLRLGMLVRLVSALVGMLVLRFLDSSPLGDGPRAPPSTLTMVLLVTTVSLATFGSSLTFVSSCAFFNSVADPLMGGSYLTLLNTISNLGRAWSVPLLLYLVDVGGFFAVNTISLALGFLYLFRSKALLQRLETLPPASWSVTEQCVV